MTNSPPEKKDSADRKGTGSFSFDIRALAEAAVRNLKQNTRLEQIERLQLVPLHIITDVGARELRVKQTKFAKYPVAMVPNECFDKPKDELPLHGGFLYGKGRCGGEKATEAIVTLDVDDRLNAEKLQEAYDQADDPRFFCSKSASGKPKVHAVVRLVSDSGKRRYFDPKKALEGLCLILGYDYAKVDPQGALKLFVTRSFVEALECTFDKPVQTVGYDELLIEVEKAESIASKGILLKPDPDCTPCYISPVSEIRSLAEAVVAGSQIGLRSKPAAAKVLAALMAVPVNEDGLRFLALECVDGLKRTQVAVALNRLTEAGILTVVEHAIKKRKCRRFRVNIPVPVVTPVSVKDPVKVVERYAGTLVESGVAAAKNYNNAEAKLVGLAVELHVEPEEVAQIAQDKWPGWFRKDRVSRLRARYKSLSKADSEKWVGRVAGVPPAEETVGMDKECEVV
jgi:hypothetical protein